ncbi:hypothetical protein JCM18237_30700 [Halorubrum luteum]
MVVLLRDGDDFVFLGPEQFADVFQFVCLVAGPISGLCSRSASDFVKLTEELDAVLRYEVETTAGEEV